MKPLFLLLLAASGAFAAAPPNILFMLSDDQAWSGLSCQMHPDMPDTKSSIVQTPKIARLAEQGMRFSAAYAPAPVCSPTRISLQTGRNPAARSACWRTTTPSSGARRSSSCSIRFGTRIRTPTPPTTRGSGASARRSMTGCATR
ncbi:MAG: sulfatase-like hydrolase/transferase [Verrucomicrobiaceae bacterium]|nr:sulfatase-like hydrolase/transferase [Verrucomicrobiaceae bacterium]